MSSLVATSGSPINAGVPYFKVVCAIEDVLGAIADACAALAASHAFPFLPRVLFRICSPKIIDYADFASLFSAFNPI